MSINYTEEPAIKTLDLSNEGLDRLMDIASSKYREYISNTPFPHIVLDNLFPNAVLVDVLQEIENSHHSIEKKFHGAENKFATPAPQLSGITVKRMMADLNSSGFCSFLESLTGISNIIPDPHFEGGGYHEIKPGGFLKVHADFSWHPMLKLDRRINLLIYLNTDWQEEWGGHLELWDEKMEQRRQKISPVFNRTIIFSTSDSSFHGHPDPLLCPEGVSRKSLALYYYSNGRPEEEASIGKSTSTNYRVRPDDSFLKKISFYTRRTALRISPPIFVSIYNFLRNKI